MENRKTIAIVGATGAQGKGLFDTILNDKSGEFKVMAVTRNAGSDKAKELKKLGVEVVEAFLKHLAFNVKYNDVPAAVYRSFGIPGADDMGNRFQFKAVFETEFCDARDINEVRGPNPDLLNFDSWLEKNKAAIKI